MTKKKNKHKKPTSHRQVVANQRNAQLSTGPQTTEGKEISSRNATAHGCYGGKVLLASESADEFDAFYSGLWEHLAPQDAMERMLVDDYIWECWRLRRLRVHEAQISEEMADVPVRQLLHELSKLSVVQMRVERSRDKAMKQLREHRVRRMAQPEMRSRSKSDPREAIQHIMEYTRQTYLGNGQNPAPPSHTDPAQTDQMGSFRAPPTPPAEDTF
jgi:hypothetical protein